MHRTSKALLTTLVATALLLPARAANAGATGSLVGVVLNDDTGQPVPGALVGACALQGCQPFATTDSTGAFTFLGVPASTDWSVQTNPDGSCALSTGHHYGIAVPAGGPSAEVVLYVTSRVGSAQGTVYSPSGQPLPGVRVTLDNAETSGSGYGAAYTDSSGHYAVGCLAAAGSGPGSGAYYVTAQPPAPYSEKVDSGIEVPQGGSVLHDVHLTPSSGWIQGRVTCGPVSCGVPMTVVIRCEGCGGAANATTDGGGYYSAAVEGGQKYDVHVFGPPGWDSGIAYAVRVPLYQTGTGNVMLTENGPSTSGRLVGTITDAAGAAIPNCTINAFGPTSFSEGVAVTGSDGTYDTGYTLAPGTFIIFPACVTGVRLSYEPSVRVGQTAEAGYVIPEPPRPFTGGSDAIGATSPGADAYFAEGFTGVNSQFSFHEYLTVENPNPSSETVDVH
ncbi:MAG: hypothetical protein ACREPI_01225, partial [Candidatus Dormibacterales bacterium]